MYSTCVFAKQVIPVNVISIYLTSGLSSRQKIIRYKNKNYHFFVLPGNTSAKILRTVQEKFFHYSRTRVKKWTCPTALKVLRPEFFY